MKNLKSLLLLLSLAICINLFGQTVNKENIQIINTENLDFSPVPFGNGMIYTSSKDRVFHCPADGVPGNFTDLYYSEKKADGTWSEPERLKGKVNGKYNDGVPTFNPADNKMIFTRNNLMGKNEFGVIDLKLYTGDLENGKWVNVDNSLPFNNDKWSTAHPTLSNDGTLLVFSSNREGSKPGLDGEPSMDLWASKYENGVWGIPYNLGDKVNTGGNEIFPYLDEQGNLFFSSDGLPGEGGLDLFAAQQNDAGMWDLVGSGNIGTDFNTGNDDVYFVPLNGGTEGFLASDHPYENAKGGDDIYYWTREGGLIDAVIQVVDKETKEPIPMADLEISPGQLSKSMEKYGPVLDKVFGTGGEKTLVLETMKAKADQDGKMEIQIPGEGVFNIIASAKDYKTENRNPSSKQLSEVEVYIIELERDVCYPTLTVLVVEKENNAPIPMAKVSVRTLGKQPEEIREVVADGEGTISVQITSEFSYEITAVKDEYYTNTVTLPKEEIDCTQKEIMRKVPLEKKPVVYLEPVFFDFDRYYIRNRDAKPTLDNLADIMMKYPSLKINLGGHTDARGSNKYNDLLSRRRAESAKEYLVKKKNIDQARISTENFGETMPANKCVDDVFCPESDHQINRRVDVIPVTHDEKKIEFKTRPISELTIISDR